MCQGHCPSACLFSSVCLCLSLCLSLFSFWSASFCVSVTICLPACLFVSVCLSDELTDSLHEEPYFSLLTTSIFLISKDIKLFCLAQGHK